MTPKFLSNSTNEKIHRAIYPTRTEKLLGSTATYEETLDKFVPGWQPSAHYHTADSCINTKCMVDGLPKLDDGGGAAVMASSGPEAPSTERI